MGLFGNERMDLNFSAGVFADSVLSDEFSWQQSVQSDLALDTSRGFC